MQDFDESRKPEKKPVIMSGDIFQLRIPTCDAAQVVARISEWRPTVRMEECKSVTVKGSRIIP